MRKRTILLGFIALLMIPLLVACLPKYTKPDVSQEQVQRDEQDCWAQARAATEASIQKHRQACDDIDKLDNPKRLPCEATLVLKDLGMEKYRLKLRVRDCMNAKGYKPTN